MNHKIDWQDESNAAATLSGNWLHFDSFSWYGQDENEPRNHQAVHYGLFNRDSAPLDRSNGQCVVRELMKIDPHQRHWHMENHSHWLCGWVEKLIIFPYHKSVKRLTPAWIKFCELQYEMDRYPVLDEDHYSQLVQSETVDPAFDEITRLVNQLLCLEHDYTGDDLTVDQIWDAYGELNLEYEEVDNDTWLKHRTGYVPGERSEDLDEEDVVRLISDWWAVQLGLAEPEEV